MAATLVFRHYSWSLFLQYVGMLSNKHSLPGVLQGWTWQYFRHKTGSLFAGANPTSRVAIIHAFDWLVVRILWRWVLLHWEA